MPKGSQFDDLARKAATRIEEAKAAGEQLTFLPDEPGQNGGLGASGGRPPRGKGKVTSQLRDWCAAKGLRLPEDVLIEMAGMASTEDAFLTAMARTEQVLAWAEAGATGYKGAPVKPSMGQRLAAFQFVYTAQLRAAEALLPYGLGKVTPDAPVLMPVPVYVAAPGGQAPIRGGERGGDGARDITPQPGRIGPPPMPVAPQRNQALSEIEPSQSDAASRTEGTTR
jgi:hypothetical protein